MTDILVKVLDKYYEGKWVTFPSPTGTMEDFDNINWIGDAPIKSDFQKQYNAEEKAYNDSKYQRDRASQYPSIQDVVVALAEKEEGNDTMWKEITSLRQKVKSENPKPT
jgi:hypothetical protein